MKEKIMNITYKIYKDGKYDGHKVGYPYIIRADGSSNKMEKDLRLKADYPIEEGYVLIKEREYELK